MMDKEVSLTIFFLNFY